MSSNFSKDSELVTRQGLSIAPHGAQLHMHAHAGLVFPRFLHTAVDILVTSAIPVAVVSAVWWWRGGVHADTARTQECGRSATGLRAWIQLGFKNVLVD